jgi:5-methylcytosine-specific restriction endonuclease McrA
MPGSFCTVCRARIAKGSRCKRHIVQSPSNRSWHERGAARTRRRVIDRDGGCVVCGATADLQVHHVVGAADGGLTAWDNLVVLCVEHHLEAETKKFGQSPSADAGTTYHSDGGVDGPCSQRPAPSACDS